ncbi:hypothetical protein LSCM1_00938 [Leishmania martiniquensis]|uniref:Protein kinase domain-containing protein n=1 Tax=Leishmania martiniquensis TaxID=1580590 RepID=A0A836KAU1_9TRYP|nr:hypothetical protein LSCM1_00938 [Leishmania martiniquensis]
MQPHQPFMFGGAQPPCTNGRYPASPLLYSHRGRMTMGPSPAQVYRSSSMGGAVPIMANGQLHHHQRGISMSGGVLPALHGTHMVAHNRIHLGQGSGAAPMPMPPPTVPGHSCMRRTAGAVRPHPVRCVGGDSYLRGMQMSASSAGRSSFQSGMSGTVHSNGGITHDVQNGGMLGGGRNEALVKPAGSGAAQHIANLPTLPLNSASMPNLQSGVYPMLPPPMMNANFRNSMPLTSCGNGYGQPSSSGARGSDLKMNETDAGGNVSAGYATHGKVRDTDSMTPSLSPSSHGQNGCRVSTQSLEQGDEVGGLTPTPPALRFLTSYEEEEVKDYLPSVYFGGTEQCQKIHGVRGADKNDGYDDDNFHYRVVVGDHLLYRYEVVRILGQGTFGIVLSALDHKYHRLMAVKVIKNKPNYTKQAREEIKTLELLNGDDPDDEANIVRLLGSHIFRNHYILVFELLPSDLYAIIQANKFRPMPRDFIYELSEQLLTALVHVRDHKIVHCDLKPENIMISYSSGNSNFGGSSSGFTLKLIDFGSACVESRPLFTYIQSRYYRAPEIVLGIPYTTAIDMWSFGCVLCELANGYPIFPASSEGELLERFVEYFGAIPSYLVRQGRRADRFFEDGQMKYNLGKKRLPHAPHSRALKNFLKIGRSPEDQLFEDFVAKCLHLDARQRLTPEAALEHPWMQLWRGSGSSGSTPSLSDASGSLSR